MRPLFLALGASPVSTADGLSAAFAMDERHILRQLEEAGGSLVSPVTVGAAVLLIVCFVCLYCCGGSKPTSQRVYAVPHTVEAVIFSLDDGTQSWSKVMALLKELRARGFHLALASSAPRTVFEAKMRDFASVTGAVDAIVTGNEVSRPKPSADLWLEAARRLRVDATRCLAFDEGPAGIAGAQAAGMLTAAVGPGVADRFRAVARDIPMPDWLLHDVSAFDTGDIERPKVPIAPLAPRGPSTGLEALLGLLPADSPLAKCLVNVGGNQAHGQGGGGGVYHGVRSGFGV